MKLSVNEKRLVSVLTAYPHLNRLSLLRRYDGRTVAALRRKGIIIVNYETDTFTLNTEKL